MSYKTFITGDNLDATTLNSYFMNQVIATCTSSTRPTGTSGRVIYETDTKLFKVYETGAWGDFASSSAYQTWSGSIGGAGGTTSFAGKFQKLGKQVSAYGKITVTAYASTTSAITLSLPFTPASSLATNQVIGTLYYFQNAGSPAQYVGAVLATGGVANATFIVNSGSTGAAIAWKGNAPTQYTGDYWTITLDYEAA